MNIIPDRKSEINLLSPPVKNLITIGKIPSHAVPMFLDKWNACANAKTTEQIFDALEGFFIFFGSINIKLEDICLMEIMTHLKYYPTITELVGYILCYRNRTMFMDMFKTLRNNTQPDPGIIYKCDLHAIPVVEDNYEIPRTPVYVSSADDVDWLKLYTPC